MQPVFIQHTNIHRDLHLMISVQYKEGLQVAVLLLLKCILQSQLVIGDRGAKEKMKMGLE